mmetsp:Transcript_131481/g.420674  ORF Transcript_131481/g.420674 Transcript_131481/m.420674 type:complete len:252 (+) Transcript_131481:1907-2662(+)
MCATPCEYGSRSELSMPNWTSRSTSNCGSAKDELRSIRPTACNSRCTASMRNSERASSSRNSSTTLRSCSNSTVGLANPLRALANAVVSSCNSPRNLSISLFKARCSESDSFEPKVADPSLSFTVASATACLSSRKASSKVLTFCCNCLFIPSPMETSLFVAAKSSCAAEAAPRDSCNAASNRSMQRCSSICALCPDRACCNVCESSEVADLLMLLSSSRLCCRSQTRRSNSWHLASESRHLPSSCSRWSI